MEEVKRDRARRKLLRVTFPNGKVLCYKSTTDTMIATMQELGDGVIANIKLLYIRNISTTQWAKTSRSSGIWRIEIKFLYLHRQSVAVGAIKCPSSRYYIPTK